MAGETLSDGWMRASTASIIRALRVAVAGAALLALVFHLVGLPEIAVPFLLAATIGLGLSVISVVWRALTEGHPDST